MMVGTANFVNPRVCVDVVEGIEHYLKRYNHSSVHEIIGKLANILEMLRF